MHFVMNVKCLRWFGNHSCKNENILRRHLCLSTWPSDYRNNNGCHRNGNFPRSLMLGGRFQPEGDLSSLKRFQTILTTCQTITVWDWNTNKMETRWLGPWLWLLRHPSWSFLYLDSLKMDLRVFCISFSIFPVCPIE